MYPFLRLIKEVFKFRKAPQLGFGDVHVSHHMCMPWDLDPWVELNNGRTLTLYDLGRIPLAARSGLLNVLKKRRWGMTMAGACVRYRRRIRMFERIEMRSRALCWDDRFIYIEQSMWKTNGECAGHIVYRGAFVGHEGIVSPERIWSALGETADRPDIPEWVATWIAAEDMRPWPPMQD